MTSGTQRMIFATGDPALAIDRRGTIVAWNAAAGRAFGYPGSRAVGCKCWELLEGQDTFGNLYCGEHCPLLEMAYQHKAVNRCRLSFRTAGDERRDFTVTTLVLFDSSSASLIHLCREETAIDHADTATPSLREERLDGAVLTHRERQVLDHLADGHSTREIATLLHISVSTVRSHIEHILQKLNAHSRLEAVAVSRRLGLH